MPDAASPQWPAVPGFVLRRHLGSGANADVYAAVRERDHRELAVKVVPSGSEQALRELLVLSRVDVEHVVRLHGSVPLPPDGSRVALVLDLVDGGSLGGLVALRGHLLPGEVVTALVPVCRAVAELHALGVVHADLSPRNVLFLRDGRPMVTDLGVAALGGTPATPAYGTPGFAAPEVLEGGAAVAASDVYSLGALIWFTLTGTPPSPLLTRPGLAEEAPRTPETLARLVDECLRPAPEDRPEAEEVAHRLFGCAAATPVRLGAVGADPANQLTHRLRAEAAASAAARAARHRKPARHDRRAGGGRGGRPRQQSRRTGARARPTGRRRAGRKASVAGWVVAASLLLAAVVGAGLGVLHRPGTAGPGAASAKAVRAVTAAGSLDADPAAAQQRPRELLQLLVDRRAAALRASDPGGLGSVFAPGSAALAEDRRTVRAAGRAGARYDGLRMTVVSASVVGGAPAGIPGAGAQVSVRAAVATTAYTTAYEDGRRARSPASPAVDHRLTLVLEPAGWRIAALAAA